MPGNWLEGGGRNWNGHLRTPTLKRPYENGFLKHNPPAKRAAVPHIAPRRLPTPQHLPFTNACAQGRTPLGWAGALSAVHTHVLAPGILPAYPTVPAGIAGNREAAPAKLHSHPNMPKFAYVYPKAYCWPCALVAVHAPRTPA